MNTISSIINDQQKRYSLIILSFFHIFIIAASNYLVQISFQITLPLQSIGFSENFSFHTTWGTLTFPFIFLATDLTVRVFGAKEARWIIFAVMIPALLVSYIISTLFSDAQYQGLQAIMTFNMFVFRIAFASFAAYVLGQLLDVFVFNRLRQLKAWWIAPSCSMVFGSMADTFIFFSIAFYMSSDPFMAKHWIEIGIVDYLFKLAIGLLLFVPAYGALLNYILHKLKSLTLQQKLA